MTEFVESFATQQLLPPWVAAGAQTWAFVVEVPQRCVEDHLAKFFNAGFNERAPFRYEPLPGRQYGLLTVSHCPATRGQGRIMKAIETWENVEHDDIFLSFPVQRRAVGPDNLIADQGALVWVQPFMCSNSATVVFSAREIWGCDMTYAEIARRGETTDPLRIHIDTAYLGPRKFSPREASKKLAGLHIETKGPRPSQDIDDLLESRPDLRLFLDSLTRSGLVPRALPAGLTAGEIGFDLHHLKQIRDVYDPNRALYRAIVATRSHYQRMDGFTFLDETQVDIAFMWSETMKEFLQGVLGLRQEVGNGAPDAHIADTVAGRSDGGQDPRTGGPAEARAWTSGVHDADWDFDNAPLVTVLAFTFTSDIVFEVQDTAYTYRASYQATR